MTPEELAESNGVVVCDACQRASCWQGVFYCERYKTAGTVVRAVSYLRRLGLEHESYWESDQ